MAEREPAQPTTAEGLPPLSDAGHWWSVISERKLRSYNPGALVALYDARDAATDPNISNEILAHVLLVARSRARKVMPSDVRSRYHAIGDVVGEVALAIADPTRQSLRRFFHNFVRLRCLDLVEDQRGWGEELDADMPEHPDPEGKAIHALDLKDVLAGIADPVKRESLAMLMAGWKQKDVAAALNRHRETISEWTKQTDVAFVEGLRSR